MKKQAVVHRAMEVAEDPLQSGAMRLPRVMHMEADPLNRIGDVRPGEGEVLLGTSKTPVGDRISNEGTLIL